MENIFLGKEIVMEVSWKLPAKIVMHAEHIQVDISGDVYSEQALIQKTCSRKCLAESLRSK